MQLIIRDLIYRSPLYWFNLDCVEVNYDINQIRKSNFYFVCETFNVSFLPYQEKISE